MERVERHTRWCNSVEFALIVLVALVSSVDFEMLGAEQKLAVLAFEGEKVDEMARGQRAVVADREKGGVAFWRLGHRGDGRGGSDPATHASPILIGRLRVGRLHKCTDKGLCDD
jgi:hypothetical protein